MLTFCGDIGGPADGLQKVPGAMGSVDREGSGGFNAELDPNGRSGRGHGWPRRSAMMAGHAAGLLPKI
ncbi:MAG: hypothetical protein ACK48N_04290, partial [Planctomyces sp.]